MNWTVIEGDYHMREPTIWQGPVRIIGTLYVYGDYATNGWPVIAEGGVVFRAKEDDARGAATGRREG